VGVGAGSLQELPGVRVANAACGALLPDGWRFVIRDRSSESEGQRWSYHMRCYAYGTGDWRPDAYAYAQLALAPSSEYIGTPHHTNRITPRRMG
jgi:hypothetical protein